MRAITIRPDKTATMHDVPTLDYQFIKGEIGGWIECIGLENGDAWCDEEFLMKYAEGDPSQYVNWAASDIASMGGRPDFLMRPIFGPVVFTGPVNGVGDTTGLTPGFERMVRLVCGEAGVHITEFVDG